LKVILEILPKLVDDIKGTLSKWRAKKKNKRTT